ncbi:GFA family protein [Aliiglaciecola sp. M165]|uniref:GFA family protein n=1 Tax=Aliiglaciecola sp. M165 TaxID=2593649 RepID=UPI00117E3000|nr:GFA family protein [Aliiglaciecola sp. M165]TRY32145.1 GFA family protein [Aliiglaciecola sp. M165]
MREGEITGGCMCGMIRYKVTTTPSCSTICHCNDCRLACGAQSVAWFSLPVESFVITKGNPKTYQSSNNATRTFCHECGTSLTYINESRAHEVDVTTSSLDDPEQFPPEKQVYEEHKLSWVKV